MKEIQEGVPLTPLGISAGRVQYRVDAGRLDVEKLAELERQGKLAAAVACICSMALGHSQVASEMMKSVPTVDVWLSGNLPSCDFPAWAQTVLGVVKQYPLGWWRFGVLNSELSPQDIAERLSRWGIPCSVIPSEATAIESKPVGEHACLAVCAVPLVLHLPCAHELQERALKAALAGRTSRSRRPKDMR